MLHVSMFWHSVGLIARRDPVDQIAKKKDKNRNPEAFCEGVGALRAQLASMCPADWKTVKGSGRKEDIAQYALGFILVLCSVPS